MTDEVAGRSRARVEERVGDEGDLSCPFCGNELSVRRSKLGWLPDTDDGERPYIEGVAMKCAGDAGCGFRPDFDVPLTETEWERELDRRDGQRAYDCGYDTDGPARDSLRALGYLPE